LAIVYDLFIKESSGCLRSSIDLMDPTRKPSSNKLTSNVNLN